MYEGYLERRLERQCVELLNAVLLLLCCYYLSHAQKHPHPQTADGELCEAAPAASHPDPPTFRGATSATQRAPSPIARPPRPLPGPRAAPRVIINFGLLFLLHYFSVCA